MCGSTYQTRKSYWWTQAVQAFELAEHVHDGLVHHEGEKNISYTVGGKLISAALWHHIRQLVEPPDRFNYQMLNFLGY